MSASRLRAWLLDGVLRQRFIQDVGVLAVANAVAAMLGLVQGVLVARWLGPELFGVTALIISYPSLLYSVFDPKSKTVSVRYLSEFNARRARDWDLARGR